MAIGGMTVLARGTALLALRAYLEQRHGPEAVTQALARMPPSLAETIRGIPIAHEWYPEEAVLGLLDAGAAEYGDTVYDEFGAFAAEYDLNRIHRFILRFTSPIWLLHRGARLWSEYHNTGRWQIEEGPMPQVSLVGTLEDFGIVRPTFCRGLTSWIRRASQLTGAREIVVVHSRCRAGGAKVCVWEGHW